MRFLVATLGLLIVAQRILNELYKYRACKRPTQHDKLMPVIELTEDGHVEKLEPFGEYVVRQLGIMTPDGDSRLSKLAEEYLRGDKSNSDRSRESILLYLSDMCPEDEIESLYKVITDELDSCILSYFAFHWDHSMFTINQINSPKNKLQSAVYSATREQSAQRIVKNLKTKSVFSTLLQESKAIGHLPNLPSEHLPSLPNETNVVMPLLAKDRSPVLLLIGGGMGVGKSTAVKDIMKSPFWSNAAKDAVVVEADAFKETNVVYQALNSSGHHDLLEASELVHHESTDAAESLLVTALNEGRDVIFDGTMSWEPFVKQTIDMARDVHWRQYRRGPGYKRAEDGSVLEKYWEPVEDTDPPNGLKTNDKQLENGRKPYRTELVGVICDAHLAVVRGVRRAIMTKRAVRVKEQLNSIKRFAVALPNYYDLVDQVNIFSTNDIGGPAKIIGWKERQSKLLVDPENLNAVTKLAFLNENARSMYELYGSLNDTVELDKAMKEALSPERALRQKQLLSKIQSIETHLLHRNSSSIKSSHSASSLML
ncbi:calmodulin calcium-dependent NAD kinase isoform X2 [Cryptomeria japonica]|uniref:calmodulin calcium-dependent NAD kinase isoform X2 n=1 Tax=Cryptomeria japonica TaxID=3369 RepID=UPI0027DA8B5E|nr:calmodulin calcium-dependent NAD kinase isoform X2 [Cryptomeria japonica]